MAIDVGVSYRAPVSAPRMRQAAIYFLESLNEIQRKQAHFPFVGDKRYVWDYRPTEMTPRNGLRLINMTAEQQERAFALYEAGLSARGLSTAKQIMSLETDLKLTERLELDPNYFVRDPEVYYFAVYGDPAGDLPWAWTSGGHHIALHFTFAGEDMVTALPQFFGANPSTVKHGPRTGLRTLVEEQDWARDLLHSLDASQRKVAVVREEAFPDILTDAYRVAYPFTTPTGIAFTALTGEQRDKLVRLVRHYVTRVNDEIAGNEWAKIERAGLDGWTFAWAGGDQPGQGHWYVIKGPTFMVEYDNTQDGANHIHSVWRDWTNDWGEDMLAQHYAVAHR